jgi:methyl-accepting chemotaxis protein
MHGGYYNMKKLKFNLQTMKAKLIAMLIGISLIPVLITGLSSYQTSKNVLSKKLETTSSQTIGEITRGLDNYFQAMSNIVNILSNDFNIESADNEESFEFAKGLIANVKSTDVSIINVFVGTEEGMFYTDPAAELPEGFDHTARDWYTQAMSNPNGVIITNPYIDTASKNIVITLAAAIHNGDKLIGVVGIDVDLAKLSTALKDIKIGDNGYLFITDKNGIMISHPDHTLIGTDTATTLSCWDDIKNNKSGFTTYVYNNANKFSSYQTSDLTGWKIIAAMDYKELSKDTQSILQTLIWVLVIVAIVSTFLAVLFSIPISRNIKGLVKSFDRLAHGDLTTNVDIRSRDEFQLLGKHFSEMAENISTLIKNVSDASVTVLDTSVLLSGMAGETNTAINEVARAVSEVANGATEQAQNSSDGAYSVSELAEKLTTIDESTAFMDNLSKNATKLTSQGLNRVQSLIQKSDITMKSTAEVSELVYETRESMKQIDAISNTIDTITAQTNLLSLNASIEAARAGESGKGFAIVANEIRKLAEQSKASTVKIKEIIENIEQKTALSVKAMEITNQNVKEQVTLVDQTQAVFDEILDAVHKLSEKVSEIKNSTDEITVKKEQIVYQIENISAISQESASATEEVTASTEEITVTMEEITNHAYNLQRLSEQLQEKMNSFKF